MGFQVFYLKVGLDIEAALDMARTLRQTIGPKAKIRLDANAAWTVNEALRNLARLDAYHHRFHRAAGGAGSAVEHAGGAAALQHVGVREQGTLDSGIFFRQTQSRTADVYCFSPYSTGSLAQFQRLCWQAHFLGLQICRHTHGELGITAAGCHHILLTLPNVVEGNQQTAHMMTDDIVTETIPITNGPAWGVPVGAGIGVEINAEKLAKYHERLSTARSISTVRSGAAGDGAVFVSNDEG